MFRRRLRLAACCAALGLPGCLWLPVAEGPAYTWQSRFAPAFSDDAPTPSPIPVAIDDRRPEWERQYRAMVESPAGWRKAIGVVPIENLKPSPLESLQNVIRTHLPTEPGDTVTVRLDSFRIVLNDTERKRQEREEQLDEAAARVAEAESGRRFHWGFFVSSGMGVGPGFGSGIDSGIDRRLGGGAPPPRSDKPVEPIFMRDYQLVRGTRAYFGPPPELPTPCYPGATCEIDGLVTVYRHGSHLQSFSVVASHRVEFGTRDGSAEISQAVEGALAEFAAKLGDDLDPRSRIRKSTQPYVDFPAQAGGSIQE